MSGHSKWSTIKRKKEKTDNQRAKIFTKIGREIAVAVREGGPDPASNSKLKDIISKAKANNVPNDNIDRIIKKAAGDGNADNYEEIMYEGYGPSGIAVIVETLTDNRNRTAGDMRHYFDKFGGNMGQSGCVSFMFSKQGVIVIEKDDDIDEEKLMEDALEAGAIDFLTDDGESVDLGGRRIIKKEAVLTTVVMISAPSPTISPQYARISRTRATPSSPQRSSMFPRATPDSKMRTISRT